MTSTILTMPNGKEPLAYLATPYSKYQGGNLELAFRDASKLAAQLMLAGLKVYSPIAHTHPLAVYGFVDPLDHDIWLPFDEAMMTAADVLIVAHMDGWQASRGIAHEIEFFERAAKPIFDLDPLTLRMTKRRGPFTREFLVTDDRSRSLSSSLDSKQAKP